MSLIVGTRCLLLCFWELLGAAPAKSAERRSRHAGRIRVLESTLSRYPHDAHANTELASLLWKEGKFQQGATHFRSAFQQSLSFDNPLPLTGTLQDLPVVDDEYTEGQFGSQHYTWNTVSEYLIPWLEHYEDQYDHLASVTAHQHFTNASQAFAKLAKALRIVQKKRIRKGRGDDPVQLSPIFKKLRLSIRQLLWACARKAVYVKDPGACTNTCLNPNLSKQQPAIEKSYHSQKGKEFVVVDNFLSDESLALLRNFAAEATVWSEAKRHYVGAYWNDGFLPEAALQIADELRRVFPNIFCDHGLNMFWGYKLGRPADGYNDGIGLHADDGAVNVNFWLNEEPREKQEGGGMDIYLAQAPMSWRSDQYNKGNFAQKWAQEHDAEKVSVSWKTNRAVIFNSNLLHRTQKHAWKNHGYTKRRINLTFIFGHRGEGGQCRRPPEESEL